MRVLNKIRLSVLLAGIGMALAGDVSAQKLAVDLTAVVAEDCIGYDGIVQEFDFSSRANMSAGVCVYAKAEAGFSYDPTLEALDLLAATGEFKIYNDIDGKTPYGLWVTPAGSKTCQCVARPRAFEYIAGMPESFDGFFGTTQNCGVIRGTWSFESCKSIGGTSTTACTSFARTSLFSEGKTKTEEFTLGSALVAGDAIGLRISDVDYWVELQEGVSAPEAVVKLAEQIQQDSVSVSPGVNGKNGVIKVSTLSFMTTSVLLKSQNAACSSGGCTSFTMRDSWTSADQQGVALLLSSALVAGDAVGIRIMDQEFWTEVRPGMSAFEVVKILEEQIRAGQVEFLADISSGTNGSSGVIKIIVKPGVSVAPLVKSQNPACTSIGGCTKLKSFHNAVEGGQRIQAFSLGSTISAGDSVGLRIYGMDFWETIQPGQSAPEVVQRLVEQIQKVMSGMPASDTAVLQSRQAVARSGLKKNLYLSKDQAVLSDFSSIDAVAADTWIAVDRMVDQPAYPVDAVSASSYKLEIGAGSDGINGIIKLAIDPSQLVIPLFKPVNPSCAQELPFKFDPSHQAIGTVIPGTSTSIGVAIFNATAHPLKGCSFFPSDSLNFAIKAGPECDNLDVGGACKVELVAQPWYQSSGTVKAHVFGACGADLGMSELYGFQYDVGNGDVLPPTLMFKPATLNFGQVKLGVASSVLNMTILNGGGLDAKGCVIYLTNPGDFIVKNPDACGIVPAGNSCTLDVVALPQGEGPRMTTLGIKCENASGESVADGIMVNLGAGTPTPTPSPTPNLAPALSFVSPASADLGSVMVGSTSSSALLTIANMGTLDATSCKMSFTGTDATQFQFESQCPNVPASGCQNMCEQKCPSGDLCGYDLKLNCCVDYTNPKAAMECPACKPGVCSFNIVGFPKLPGAMKATASITCAVGGTALSATNGIVMNATQPASSPTPTPTPSCSTEGAYKSASGDCVCPAGYEVSPTASGSSACRPALHTSEFAKAGDFFSDGYPVCGKGRMPMTTSFALSDISTHSKPLSSLSFTKLGNTYSFARDTSTDPAVVGAQYLYVAADLKRCVCSASDVSYNAGTTSGSSGKVISGSGRFVSDLHEVVSAVSGANPNPDTYSAVPIAHDGASNGYLGSVYYPGHGGAGSAQASCACPNLNEKMTAISSVAGSGYSCSTALDTSDDLTKKYLVLAAYDPAIHDVSASNTQVLDRTAPTSKVSRIPLPSASGGYKFYSRKIWTCAPPAVLDLSSKTCKIKDSQHACDNGSGSGVPSPVSPNMSGSTSKDQFDNAANRKLACCLNSYDRRNPLNPVKYDCIQNADQNPLDFDKLWMSKDPDEAGGQGNAIVLTDGGGRPVTGFFSLSGARCAAYSEFAAPIRVAAVNPIQVAGQQTLSGGQTDPNKITFSGEIMGPPPAAPSWFASNRSVPDLAPKAAQEMRNCPVLARAAIVATCGDGNSSGKLPQQFTDSKGNIRCLAAQSVKVHLRIQQVYTITGMAPMKTIDTVVDLEDAKRSGMNLEGMIRARAGTFCPVGASYVDGNCIFK